MRKANYYWLVLMLAPLAYAVRDPFLPVIDRCAPPLAGAQFRGWVASGDHPIVLVEVASGHWRRWVANSPVAEGWSVGEIDDQQVVISGPDGCLPQILPLSQQGVAHDEATKNRSAPGVVRPAYGSAASAR